ncbi:hypothetical protein [Ohessyouella blattaphilus]|uniref:Lipoprotein n=1 Tax=Ohessyouella blattaphilus TaxID=2949333 RepID=A0ABT1EII9_9FIRM|nr:hypothetical protein [Ohessyouella blattaphilus]MCP1109501.1 hypothetical protein [Ohessyouella blattaphilus]MCR8562895.1 hypothetical protein [Ohessyouella blattaphilus]MDL2250112.1 hypothetical protein [Lachnospiraceae bacterium OttesenSCG-928-J05]
MRFRLLKVILCIALFFLMIGCTSRKDIEEQNIEANEDSQDKVVDGIMFEVSKEPNPPYTEGKVYTEVVYQEELEDIVRSMSDMISTDEKVTIEDICHAELVYTYARRPEMILVDFKQECGMLWERDAGLNYVSMESYASGSFSCVSEGQRKYWDVGHGYITEDGVVYVHNMAEDEMGEMTKEQEAKVLQREKKTHERRMKAKEKR